MKLSPSSQKIVAVIVIFAVIATIVVSIASLTRRDSNGEGNSNIYNDPASRQSITEQTNKAPEAGSPDDVGATPQPTFAGLNVLLDRGYSLSEINATKKAFTSYKPVSDSKGLISIVVDSIQIGYPEESDPDGRFYITSGVVYRLNEKNTNYNMKLYHNGIDEVQLILKNATGDQVYDSGKVTAN